MSSPTPPSDRVLAALLREIDGRGYKAYKALGESYRFGRFRLRFDHVQGDPFADPSRVAVLFDGDALHLPEEVLATASRRTAAADHLNRLLVASLEEWSLPAGSGRSGEMTILRPGQEVLRRSAVMVAENGGTEIRLRVGLPASGRSVLGGEAIRLLLERLPAALEVVRPEGGRDDAALLRQVHAVEDAQALRDQLADRRLVAFVADGSRLPRRSGVDDRPLEGSDAVPFRSPASLRVTLPTPNSGPVLGMGVPEGITLLVGGGYHGKSTLLRALERGIYDHLPGDGRERVVTRPDAVKIRAEDGRAVAGTDISGFIGDLPGGVSTDRFVTANASGSTSQAAALVEALELGSRCLLVDEDTSASNFLIRDARTRALITGTDEPITPLIDRITGLRDGGVSLIMVVGGSGDYFDVADTVIAMREYVPREVTAHAREIAAERPTGVGRDSGGWPGFFPRPADPDRIQPRRGRREVEIRAFSANRLMIGVEEVDLSAVEQLVEAAQVRAIGAALAWARGRCIDGHSTLDAALRCVMECLERHGFDRIDPRRIGEYASFRIYELGATLNRLRAVREDEGRG